MASAVATPLERQFGRIAGINQMTSSSQLGSTGITMQFDLNRNIDAAARDVQAAINAARNYLPPNLPSNPTYRKINPADAPIMILAMTSDAHDPGPDVRRGRLDHGTEAVAGRRRRPGLRVGIVAAGGSHRGQSPIALNNMGLGLETVRTAVAAAECQSGQGLAGRRQQDAG